MIGFAGLQANVYVYVGNDPVNGIDPTGKRALTTQEAEFLESYFGSSLDTSAIDLGTSLGNRSWSPYGNRISLAENHFTNGTVNLSDPTTAATFAHEAIHVWQRQTGVWVTALGGWLQAKYSLGIDDPYHYQSSNDPQGILNSFITGNIEQQGQIFEDYVYQDRIGGKTFPFSSVAQYVQGQCF